MWLKLQSVIPFGRILGLQNPHLEPHSYYTFSIYSDLTDDLFFFLPFQDLVKQVLSALRAIAGNDDVKDGIVNAGGAELIVMAVNRHMSNAQVTLPVIIWWKCK